WLKVQTLSIMLKFVVVPVMEGLALPTSIATNIQQRVDLTGATGAEEAILYCGAIVNYGRFCTLNTESTLSLSPAGRAPAHCNMARTEKMKSWKFRWALSPGMPKQGKSYLILPKTVKPRFSHPGGAAD